MVFFGFTQCPDVCLTSMPTLAEVKRLMGDKGEMLRVLRPRSRITDLKPPDPVTA